LVATATNKKMPDGTLSQLANFGPPDGRRWAVVTVLAVVSLGTCDKIRQLRGKREREKERKRE
jgi:hypothetical protein